MARVSLFIALALLSGSNSAALRGDDEAVGLRTAWTAPLGSAYSRVALADGIAATQFSDGESDFVVALDASDGSTRWKHRLGPIYRGHDGSEDGPISTPVIGADSVFALDPRGQLVALDVQSGEVRWTKDLVKDFGAAEPDYGFTTTPVLEGGVLVVQAGGADGHNLCGLDAKTGELRWSVGEGEAGYQSPVVHELAGRRQLIVLNGDSLQGVAPFDGEALWTHELGEQYAGSGSAGVIDAERFFLFVSGKLNVFRVTRSDEGFTVESVFATRELGGTYARPVYHGGYLYGYKSTFLTCVDATTGKRVWKSRPPGGRGLVLVDDHLIVFGAEGVVAVVRATPEGYIEEGRVQALEHSGYAWPTFGDGRVLVRNSKEVACLEVVTEGRATLAQATGSDVPDDHALAAFVRELGTASDPAARIDAFLAEHPEMPWVDGELVHFVYRGEAEDVAISGGMTYGAHAESLVRVPGTDFFHRTYRIEPGARWEYTFQVDFGDRIIDPLNPNTVPGAFAPVSEVASREYERPKHLAEPTGPRGRIETYEFTSEQLDNTRELTVYLPAGYDDGDAQLPVLLLHNGPDWLEKGQMQNTLDNVIGSSVRPLIVVFVAPMQRWWFEGGGSQTEAYLEMLATELLPDVASRYRVSREPQDVAIAGVRSFGLTAALGAAAHPDVFGKAAIQSVSLEDVARHALFEHLTTKPPKGSTFYVDWNRYENVNLDQGEDYASFGPRLFGALREAGCTVRGGEALDSHGWGGWRARADAWLEALFPLE